MAPGWQVVCVLLAGPDTPLSGAGRRWGSELAAVGPGSTGRGRARSLDAREGVTGQPASPAHSRDPKAGLLPSLLWAHSSVPRAGACRVGGPVGPGGSSHPSLAHCSGRHGHSPSPGAAELAMAIPVVTHFPETGQ